jgi:hypothetical protein
MNEDLEQLLQNLKLKTVAAHFDEMLAAAEQNGTPVQTLVTQLLRAEWACPPGEGAAGTHRPRGLPGSLDPGILPVQTAEGRQGTSDPHLCRTGLHPQGREHRVHR